MKRACAKSATLTHAAWLASDSNWSRNVQYATEAHPAVVRSMLPNFDGKVRLITELSQQRRCQSFGATAGAVPLLVNANVPKIVPTTISGLPSFSCGPEA